MTHAARRTLLYIVIVALSGIVLCVACTAIASAACYVCEAAEPAPLPHLYLPAVMHMPRMSAEYTPAEPVATPEPDVEH